MSATPCCQHVLAQGPCAQVSRCTCGHLHLSVGPVTLRLEEPVLLSVWGTLREAVEALGSAAEGGVLPAGGASGRRPPSGSWPQ